jgi:type VI secretion system secreted protein VgrG
MAQFVNVKIEIEGNAIRQFTSLMLTQSIFEHHQFRLVCPTEAIDGTSGDILHQSRDMIGGTINIKVDSVGADGSLQFAGVVTRVEAARHSGHTGDVIIEGFSPTILLQTGPHCQSWEKHGLTDITQDVLTPFPQNLLSANIGPDYQEILAYTVQYKESAWEFLGRLGATYGEWLYYDGQQLVLGPPQNDRVLLDYGVDLHRFSMAVQVRPANFQLMAYDYTNVEVYTSEPSGIADKAGLNDMGQFALQKSQKFFGMQPKEWLNRFLTNKKQLDDQADARASMQSSSLVRFDGSSGNPGVQLCGTVSVRGKNVYSQSDETFGDYTVISVHHHLDGQGNYSNDFTAIPASVKMPPVEPRPEPNSETQSGVVTDNNDPKGLGRIRVQLRWMEDGEKTPWLRVASPHGGNGKGMYFLPEVGEEVIVGFEGDSPSKPYIIGTVWHGNAKTTFGNSNNDRKVIQTRSGNLIIMDDHAGSVMVSDSDDNNIHLDGSGNISIAANKSITLTVGHAKIEMHENGNIDITGTIITTTGENSVEMKSGIASVKLDGTTNEADMAGDKCKITGNTEVDVSGLKTAVGGITELDLTGAQISVQGTAKVGVQAPMITLN